MRIFFRFQTTRIFNVKRATTITVTVIVGNSKYSIL